MLGRIRINGDGYGRELTNAHGRDGRSGAAGGGRGREQAASALGRTESMPIAQFHQPLG
jgi:hypothetical protein